MVRGAAADRTTRAWLRRVGLPACVGSVPSVPVAWGGGRLPRPVQQAPAWLGASAADPTVDIKVNGSTPDAAPAAAAVLTAQREDCTRCGTRMDAAAHFCSTCGQPRS